MKKYIEEKDVVVAGKEEVNMTYIGIYDNMKYRILEYFEEDEEETDEKNTEMQNKKQDEA